MEITEGCPAAQSGRPFSVYVRRRDEPHPVLIVDPYVPAVVVDHRVMSGAQQGPIAEVAAAAVPPVDDVVGGAP